MSSETEKDIEKIITEGIIEGLETAKKYTGVKNIPALKRLKKKQAYYTINVMDIVSWILAAICFILPLITISNRYELWFFGLALLSTMLVRSVAARIATFIFVPIYFIFMYIGGMLINYIDIFNFIFFINTLSLTNVVVGISITTILAMWGIIGGLKGKRYRSGLGIVAFGLLLSVIDSIISYFFLVPNDIYFALILFASHFIAYVTALILTWTIFYIISRVFIVSVKSISRISY